MKYLIAIDDSEASNNVFNTACALINKKEDELFILSVSEPVPKYFASGFAYSMMLEAERHFDLSTTHNLKHFGAECERYGINHHLIMGKSAKIGEVICRAIDKKGIDFLVVGRRGLGAVKSTLFGSVSQYCVSHANCDIIIAKTEMLPPEIHDSDLETIKKLEEEEKSRRVAEQTNSNNIRKEVEKAKQAKSLAVRMMEELERKRRIKEEVDKIKEQDKKQKEQEPEIESAELFFKNREKLLDELKHHKMEFMDHAI